MDEDAIWGVLTDALYSDIKKEDEFYNKKPLLAHYTSLGALEKILANEEIWFSNPLFMNDREEINFGVSKGVAAIRKSESIKAALGTAGRNKTFTDGLGGYVCEFIQKSLFETYVLCFSEHTPGNSDGLLSMWRGYGANGRGCALVLDTSKVMHVEESPLVIVQVHYASQEKRIAWFEGLAERFAEILGSIPIPDDKLYLASAAIFQRIKLAALSLKHTGFSEEREWRIIYTTERDADGRLKHMQDFRNGPRGVEPILRFKMEPLEGITAPDLSFDDLLQAILLGPSTSSYIAVRCVERMLDVLKKPHLKERVSASMIPFRPD